MAFSVPEFNLKADLYSVEHLVGKTFREQVDCNLAMGRRVTWPWGEGSPGAGASGFGPALLLPARTDIRSRVQGVDSDIVGSRPGLAGGIPWQVGTMSGGASRMSTGWPICTRLRPTMNGRRSMAYPSGLFLDHRTWVQVDVRDVFFCAACRRWSVFQNGGMRLCCPGSGDAWCGKCYANVKGRESYRGHMGYRRPAPARRLPCMPLKIPSRSGNGQSQGAAASSLTECLSAFANVVEFLSSLSGPGNSKRF